MKVVKVQKVLKNPQLSQIAFGIGDIDANPDLYSIMAYCRNNNIIPNITINGYHMNDYHFDMLAKYCGAVAVSHYTDDVCFNAIQELTSRGMKQVNIHQLLAQETLDASHKLIEAARSDERLKGLNAIVFLLLKPKGARNSLTGVSDLASYRDLFLHAREAGIQFGMDSCSAPNLLKATEGRNLFDTRSVEPCESGLFSLYINTRGEAFPCSFMEGQPDWQDGIPLLEVNDFLQDVWLHPRIRGWRQRILGSSQQTICDGCSFQKNCRSCPEYQLSICKRRD